MKIEWIKKFRKIWSKKHNQMVTMGFYRLNVLDTYNYNMNNVDIADQLAEVYQWDHWMRKRKWWWAIMFWVLQQQIMNAFICYKKYMRLHCLKPMSHYTFLEKVALVWLKEGISFFRKNNRKRKAVVVVNNDDNVARNEENNDIICIKASSLSQSVSSSSRKSTMTRSVIKRFKNARNISITDEALEPFKGELKCCLDHANVRHMPSKVVGKHKYCQLNFWATREKKHSQLLKCDACGVNLCVDYYSVYHSEENLVGKKDALACGKK